MMQRLQQFEKNYTSSDDTENAHRIFIVHINIIIYAFAYWLTQPILPFLAKDLGADPILFAYLQTICSLLLLLGGPIIGRFCDTQGPRGALIISQFGATFQYFFLGLSYNIKLLFLSQIPTILMHCMHAAQATITLLSKEESRAKCLGKLSLSYGIGMIMGSSIGGVLGTRLGNSWVAFLASLLSFTSIPLNYYCLPNLKATDNKKQNLSKHNLRGLHLGNILKLLKQPLMTGLVFLQVLGGLGIAIYQKSFTQIMQLHFKLTSEQIGGLMGFGGIISIIGNAFLVGYFTSRFSDWNVLMGVLFGAAVCLLSYSQITTATSVFFVAVPLSVFTSISYTLFASIMSKSVSLEDSATSIGLGHASRTFCNVLAPIIAGYLYKDVGFSAIGMSSSALVSSSMIFLFYFTSKKMDKKQIEKRDL